MTEEIQSEEIQSKKRQHPADGQQRVVIVGGGLVDSQQRLLYLAEVSVLNL